MTHLQGRIDWNIIKDIYLTKNINNIHNYKIKLNYLKKQIIGQINDFAKTIKINSNSNNSNFDINYINKFNIPFDLDKFDVSTITKTVNNTIKGYYRNSDDEGCVMLITKWLLLCGDTEAIEKMKSIEFGRLETVSFSQFYPFGIKQLRYEVMSMYIHINLLIMLVINNDINDNYFNDKFWNRIFNKFGEYTEDYYSHLIDGTFDVSKYPKNDDENIKKFCDLNRLMDNAKKLFRTMVLMQYLSNQNTSTEFKLENNWNEVIDYIFDNIRCYFIK